MGREGDGPGEFRAVLRVAIVGDTIITLDQSLRRVSLWLPDGGFISSYSIASYDEVSINVHGFRTTTEYVATSLARLLQGPAGLQEGIIQVLIVDGPRGAVSSIAERLWSREFVAHRQGGSTSYRVPFLGQSYVLVSGGNLVTVPLDSTFVRITDFAEGSDGRVVPLGLTNEPFDPSVIAAHRDSLLQSLDRESARGVRFGPGIPAGIREVFGDDFPIPEFAPLFSEAQSVAHQVWLRSTGRESGDDALWTVVDVEAGEVLGTVAIPKGWQVLGGGNRSVLILQRDALDQQHVAIYEMPY
jgi:hypothetical protein